MLEDEDVVFADVAVMYVSNGFSIFVVVVVVDVGGGGGGPAA